MMGGKLKPKPLEVIIQYEKEILEAYEGHKSPKKAYGLLGDHITSKVGYNTFKGIVPVYYAVYEKFKKELEELKRKGKDKAGKEETKKGNIKGWSIQVKRGKYYNLAKKIGGKTKFIYIGKEWDEQKALEKIAEYGSGNGNTDPDRASAESESMESATV